MKYKITITIILICVLIVLNGCKEEELEGDWELVGDSTCLIEEPMCTAFTTSGIIIFPENETERLKQDYNVTGISC